MAKADEVLPRGAARIPSWWMEITPHDVLDMEQDEQRRDREYQDAVMYAKLAAQDDYKQQHGEGADGGYKKGPNGEWLHPDGTPVFRRGKKGEWLDKDGNLLYKKGAGGEWEDKDGNPLGRNFKPGEQPPGYVPGGHYDPSNFGSGSKSPSANLSSTGQYARDANKEWSKPAWAQMKLKSTGTGQNIRQGKYSKTYPRGEESTPKDTKSEADADAPPEPAASEEHEEYEVVEDDEEEIIEEYEEEEIIEEEIIEE